MVKGDEVIFANYATADSLSEICFLKVKVNFRKKNNKVREAKKKVEEEREFVRQILLEKQR